jgi:hypothetical protein
MLTNEQKRVIVMTAYASIFTSKERGTDITMVEIRHPAIVGGVKKGRWFKDSSTGQQTLRGFDLDIQLDPGKVAQLRMIEQNPNKRDSMGNLKPMAAAARAGTKIMWVIDRNGGFLSKVQDGRLEKMNTPAYSKNKSAVQSVPSAPPATSEEILDPSLDELPDLQDIDQIPGMVEALANSGFDE